MKKIFTAMLMLFIAGIAQAQSWSLNGNSTVTDSSKLGSINKKPVRFFASNVERMRLTEAGNFGIGTATPNARLHVVSPSASTASFDGPANMYMSLYEAGVYRGYIGSFAGAANDVDFGTGTNNSTGKVHLTIQAVPKLTIDAAGNVGIGTTAPAAKTQIVHNSTVPSPQLLLYENQADYARLSFQNAASSSYWTIAGLNSATNTAERLNFYNSTSGDILSLTGNGQVVIGNTVPATGYKLSVRGKVICEEVKVALQGSWPDYVFKKDYKLMNLKDLDAYIQTNKHLPEIAPAEQMEKGGIDVGETQRLLMQKIEELTLYVIDINKRMKILEDENTSLKNSIAHQNN